MGTFVLIVVLIALGAWWYWYFQESKKALATDVAHSRHSLEETAQIIGNSFKGAQSVLWTTAEGPGQINMRRRGKADGITMSFDLETVESGGTDVSMWASRYAEKFLLVNFAGVVNRRKRSIAKLVA